MKSRITITGIKEIDNALRAMPQALEDKVLQSAGVAAAKPLVTKAKLTAPEGPTGNLVDSIGAVKGGRSRSDREKGEVSVGPRRGGRNRGYAGHLVEYGTKRRYNKKGANRGVMPKKPFMKPAFEATKDQVIRNYNEELAKVIVRTMKKTLKK